MDNLKLDIDLKNLSETEKEKLLALVKKASKKPAPYFIPEKGENYWSVSGDGETCHCVHTNHSWDINAIEIGNCFRTEKEAKEARTRMKMRAKWKRLSLEAGEADNPWNGQHGHYYVWRTNDNDIYVDAVYSGTHGITTFPSKDSIEAAVKELGEQNVIDYILGDKGDLS